MGSVARASRAKRFIDEFENDWIKKKGMLFHNTVSQHLGYDEDTQVVRHYIVLTEITGDEALLTTDTEIFNPEDEQDSGEYGLVPYLAECLEQDREHIIKRLKKGMK